MQFNVYYKNNVCGTINTYNEGLYTIFDVNCSIINYNISRVYLKNNNNKINLGVLMPKGDRYVLKKRFPSSFITKNNINESFLAYIICENDTNANISDKNLAKIIDSNIFCEKLPNFDVYITKFNVNVPFLFDFAFCICNIIKYNNEYYAILKTDKNGKIIV